MPLLDSAEVPRRGRAPRWLGGLLLVVAAGALAAWLGRRPSPPRVAPPPPVTPAPRRAASPSAPHGGTLLVTATAPEAVVFLDGRRVGLAPQRIPDLAGGEHVVRVEKEGKDPFERSVHVIPGREVALDAHFEAERPRLRVESDVPGAQVFLDHKFVGTTPLDLADVALGSHRLNVSAEGHGMHAEDIEFTRTRTVQVHFKEVRLDASFEAVHKHGVGSCEGRLVASPDGVRYAATRGDDSFAVPLADVETLEVDYLKKNLKLRVRGGKTYNFGDKAGNADVLFTFRTQVEEARGKVR